ncbi:MAG TPA: SH3 domain-containing protein, partial [Chloroflexota bacterium]|nr:SH3 domain-containing protein [Chloroflexota bacterium]
TIRSPLQSQIAEITGVSMSPTNARAGDTLTVTITVKNTSTEVIHTQGPDPKFTYVQGQTFFSQNFASQAGKLRVGVSFDGHPSIDFPYRWGLGGDLAPGASTTVVGYIKLTYDMKPTNFWAGLIEEPATILQDNEGTTLISVLPDNVAVVSVDAANVRSGPDLASSVIGQLGYGTEVPILGQEKDWFKVKMPDGRQGFVAAGWIIAPQAGKGG